MICLGGFSGLDTRTAFIAALALGLPVTLAVPHLVTEI